jgi:hypothetical protein
LHVQCWTFPKENKDGVREKRVMIRGSLSAFPFVTGRGGGRIITQGCHIEQF